MTRSGDLIHHPITLSSQHLLSRGAVAVQELRPADAAEVGACSTSSAVWVACARSTSAIEDAVLFTVLQVPGDGEVKVPYDGSKRHG